MVQGQTQSAAHPMWSATPFRHSWVDAVHDWVALRPWPAWATYLTAWIVLAGTETVAKWIDGTYPAGTFFPYHLVVHATGIYILALLHHLDVMSSRAMDAIRPILSLSEEDFERVRHALTRMPARGVGIAYLLGMAFALFQRITIVGPHIEKYNYAAGGPVFVFETLTIPMFVWPLIFVYVFHMLRQLRLIDRLFRRHARIDLFLTRPLYAFSGVAARNAIGILIVGYAWIAAYPSDVGAPVLGLLFATEGVLVGIAILAFLWPLWGAHVRLAEERIRRRQEAHRNMDLVMRTLHERVAQADYAIMEGLTKAIAGLSDELRLIQGASTWPWAPSTLRAFLTAVLLPMFLWGTQQALSRMLLG